VLKTNFLRSWQSRTWSRHLLFLFVLTRAPTGPVISQINSFPWPHTLKLPCVYHTVFQGVLTLSFTDQDPVCMSHEFIDLAKLINFNPSYLRVFPLEADYLKIYWTYRSLMTWCTPKIDKIRNLFKNSIQI
jgi:hypothetical protein